MNLKVNDRVRYNANARVIGDVADKVGTITKMHDTTFASVQWDNDQPDSPVVILASQLVKAADNA